MEFTIRLDVIQIVNQLLKGGFVEMNDEKKKFIVPEAEIVDFVDEDIITYSTGGEYGDAWTGPDTEWWPS